MLVFKLKKPILLTTVALLVALLVFLSSFRITVKEQYTTIPLVVGTWGQQDNQFGRALGKDGNYHGPQSFWVTAAGGVDVLDTYNSRVLIFSPRGRLEGGFTYRPRGGMFQLMDNITVGKSSNLYLANVSAGKVEKLTPAGRSILSFSPPTVGGAATPILESLAAAPSGSIYLQDLLTTVGAYQDRLSVFDRQGMLLKTLNAVRIKPDGSWQAEQGSTIPVEVSSFVPGPNGDLYVETAGNDLNRSILVYGPNGKPLQHFRVGEADLIWSSSLVGVDGNGRIYVGFNLGTPQGKIEQLSPTGKVLQVLAAPADTTVRAHVYARVDAAGNVYLMREGSQGVTLEELVRSSVRRWETRF